MLLTVVNNSHYYRTKLLNYTGLS